MKTGYDRRRFLQTSVAAGAVLGLSGAGLQRVSVSAQERSGTTAGGDFANPQVSPGRVVWCDSFEAACAASRSSGKPVFLFHMMGRLDQRFC
jgi:hypothetical protein